MSNETMQLLFGAIIPLSTLIGAIGALIVSVRTGGKVAEVHVLANSNLGKVTAENQVLAARINGLERMIAVLTETKVETLRVASAGTLREDLTRERQARNASEVTAMQGAHDLAEARVALAIAERSPAIQFAPGAAAPVAPSPTDVVVVNTKDDPANVQFRK